MAKLTAKTLRPEMVQVEVDRVFLQQPQPFQHREIAAEADGDRGKDDMEGDREAELDASQFQSAQAEHEFSFSLSGSFIWAPGVASKTKRRCSDGGRADDRFAALLGGATLVCLRTPMRA